MMVVRSFWWCSRVSRGRSLRTRRHIAPRSGAWKRRGVVAILTAVVSVIAGSAQAGPYIFQTLAGVSAIGSSDGSGSAARFFSPSGVAVDSSGTVYVADTGNNTIRKITSGGAVTTLAGLAGSSGSADGTGPGARFSRPTGVAVDVSGTVYVADTGNNTIRKITSGGTVTTLAGLAGSFGSNDGTGSAARFSFPGGVAVDSSGTVYVADTNNQTIRIVTSGGSVTTLAGLSGIPGAADGTGSTARFSFPRAIAVDSSG